MVVDPTYDKQLSTDHQMAGPGMIPSFEGPTDQKFPPSMWTLYAHESLPAIGTVVLQTSEAGIT